MVNDGCQNSSILSDLTETESSRLQNLANGVNRYNQFNDNSTIDQDAYKCKKTTRTGSTVSDATCLELDHDQQQPFKKCKNWLQLTFDLNFKYEEDESD